MTCIFIFSFKRYIYWYKHVLSCSVVSDSCDPTDCSLPVSSVHRDSPGKNTAVGCHALLQGIFPTQGLNPSLPDCRCILYCLNHQGSHLYFSAGIFLIYEIILLFKFYEYFNRFIKMYLGPFRNCVFNFVFNKVELKLLFHHELINELIT